MAGQCKQYHELLLRALLPNVMAALEQHGQHDDCQGPLVSIVTCADKDAIYRFDNAAEDCSLSLRSTRSCTRCLHAFQT